MKKYLATIFVLNLFLVTSTRAMQVPPAEDGFPEPEQMIESSEPRPEPESDPRIREDYQRNPEEELKMREDHIRELKENNRVLEMQANIFEKGIQGEDIQGKDMSENNNEENSFIDYLFDPTVLAAIISALTIIITTVLTLIFRKK